MLTYSPYGGLSLFWEWMLRAEKSYLLPFCVYTYIYICMDVYIHRHTHTHRLLSIPHRHLLICPPKKTTFCYLLFALVSS